MIALLLFLRDDDRLIGGNDAMQKDCNANE
jgi:hypothetical protein